MKVSECVACDGCAMQRLFPDNVYVPPKMGPSYRIQIAEAPGGDEEIQLEPLVGAAGKLQDRLNRQAGISRDDITLINIIQCRPPDNIFPTDPKARVYISEADAEQAVKHCIKYHVLPVLESRPWTRIDLLGAKALEWLTDKVGGVFKWRGSPTTVDTDEVRKQVS